MRRLKGGKAMPGKYEYMVQLWGGFFNDKDRNNGPITKGYHWFDTGYERANFIRLARMAAKDAGEIIAISENEGNDTRTKTIAKMDLVYKDIQYPFEYDFGHGYQGASAEWMFREGNYACDCNRSLFLIRDCDVKIEELCCGDEISIENFKVELRSE